MLETIRYDKRFLFRGSLGDCSGLYGFIGPAHLNESYPKDFCAFFRPLTDAN